MHPADCLKTRPKTVALIGLGVSRLAYGEQVCLDGCKTNWDEIWTVNFGGFVYRHNKLWVMDDLRAQAQNLPSYGDFLRQHPGPIITSTPYPEFPTSVRFPIEEVVQALGDDFLNSTVAYALGWAMMIGVKAMWLYGCDFHYPNQTRAEEGGQCAAYLLGLARHFGMTFHIPHTTTLLGAYRGVQVGESVRRPLYGYAKQPFIPEEAVHGPGPQASPRDGADQGDQRVPAGAGAAHGVPGPGGGAGDLHPVGGDLLRGREARGEPAGVVLGGLPQDDPGAPPAAWRAPAGGAVNLGGDGDTPSPARFAPGETAIRYDTLPPAEADRR